MSDVAIQKATGCDWEKWVFCLDYVGAQDWSHRAIADHVHTAYKVKDARVRKQWLIGAKVTVKKATPNRSVRMLWDDGTPVEVWIVPKGARKTAAQVGHRKLASKEDADRRKKYWDRRLSALADVLG